MEIKVCDKLSGILHIKNILNWATVRQSQVNLNIPRTAAIESLAYGKNWTSNASPADMITSFLQPVAFSILDLTGGHAHFISGQRAAAGCTVSVAFCSGDVGLPVSEIRNLTGPALGKCQNVASN